MSSAHFLICLVAILPALTQGRAIYSAPAYSMPVYTVPYTRVLSNPVNTGVAPVNSAVSSVNTAVAPANTGAAAVNTGVAQVSTGVAPISTGMTGQAMTMTAPGRQPFGMRNAIFFGDMPDMPEAPEYMFAGPGMTFGGSSLQLPGTTFTQFSGLNTNTVVSPGMNIVSPGMPGHVQTINPAAMPLDGTYYANGGRLEITRDGRDISVDPRF